MYVGLAQLEIFFTPYSLTPLATNHEKYLLAIVYPSPWLSWV
jgi:hypothetical protein